VKFWGYHRGPSSKKASTGLGSALLLLCTQAFVGLRLVMELKVVTISDGELELSHAKEGMK
jgi:hypothetical protein